MVFFEVFCVSYIITLGHAIESAGKVVGSHSLVYLLGLLEPFGEITGTMYGVADFLTPFAVDILHPGEMEVNNADAGNNS